jgi:hypothetical protein
LEPLYKILIDKIHEGLHEKFKEVMKKKDFKKNDVGSGREFVEAYVPFVHYVEALYDTAAKGGATIPRKLRRKRAQALTSQLIKTIARQPGEGRP